MNIRLPPPLSIFLAMIIYNTKVTAAGVAELKRALPGIDVLMP
jgi:hypothetical protein